MKTVFRWIGTVLGLLVFVVLVIIALGTGLSVSHSAVCTAEIAAPVDAVWKTVDNALDISWRSDVVRVEPVAPAHDINIEWIEVDRNGQSIRYQRVSEQVDRYIVNRIADQSLPFGGTWRYGFSPAPRGTRISLKEDGEIYNPVFRLMARYFMGYTSTMARHLTDIGKHFGQTAVVDCKVTEPK